MNKKPPKNNDDIHSLEDEKEIASKKEIHQSEEHYHSLFENAPISLWEDDFSLVKTYINLLKKNGVTNFTKHFKENPNSFEKCIRLIKVVDINQASVRLNKAANKAELRSRAWELFTEESMNSFQKSLVNLIDGETLLSFQTVTKALDGGNIYQTMQWRVLPGHEENWERVIVSAQDIGELQKTQYMLENSEDSYRDLFNNIDDAIYIQNKDGYFLDVNQGAENLYGIPKEEFIGKTQDFLSAPEKNNPDDILKKIQAAFKGEPQEFEFWGKKSNGEVFPKEVHIYKGNYFGEEVIIALARDITARKKNEAALKRQLNELNILQATAFTCSQATEQKSLIRQITNIIGNTLYPDNFGILLLDQTTKKLQPVPSYQGVSVEEMYKPYPLSKGITGKVASTGKPLRVSNVKNFPDYEVFTSSTRSELCVPIKAEKKILGVINAESSKEDFFTEENERLLVTIAGQVATSMEKIHLLETEQKRRQIAEKLQVSAAILTTTLSQEKAIELILEELSQVVTFDSASVQLLDKNHLKITGGRGKLVLKEEKDRHFAFPGDNPNTVVIKTKRPLILKNAPLSYPQFIKMPSIQSWLGVPLIVHERPIGILTLDSGKTDHFTKEDARLVTSFANHAAIAITNAKLFDAEKKRRQEAETLRETALAITSSLNLRESVQHILEQLSRVLPYDSASVQILEDNELRIFGGRGWLNPDVVEKLRFSLDGSNPNTRVMREKNVVILNDAQTQHPPFSLPPHSHIRSWMGVPLNFRGKVIGMLAVDSKEKGYFTEESANLAQSFANQAAIAVENAHLFNIEQTRRQEAETLRQSAHTISSSLNLDEVLSTILASIKRVISYDSASIMLFVEGMVQITGGYGLPDMKNLIGKTFPTGDELLKQLVSHAYPVIIADAQKSPYFKNWAGTSYVHGWMGIPLIARGKVIGYITLDSREPNAYQEKDAELAQTFAHQAASAIENARLYKEALRASERRTILHRLSQDISQGIKSPESTYQAVHHATEELMICDAFVISLKGDELESDNEAVYLIEQGKRHSARTIPRGKSIVSLTEERNGSFLTKNWQLEKESNQMERFGSSKKICSFIVSPMYIEDKLLGVISAQSYTPNAYGEEEKILLEMLASHAAAAIENARLFYQTERRGKEFSELYNITQDLVTQQKLETLLKTTIERAAELLDVSCGDIYLYNPKTETLKPTITYGLNGEYKKKVESTSLRKGEGMAGHVAETLQAFRVNDYFAWEGKAEEYKDDTFTSVLGIPMLYADNLIGVMNLYETYPDTHLFTEDDERIMTLFATQVAGAIHSTKQFEQINDRLAQLETVNRTSTALRSAKTPTEMLEILIKEVSDSLKVDASTIWISDSNSNEIYRAVSSHAWIEEIQPKRQPDHIGLIGHIYQSGKSYLAPSMSDDPFVQLASGKKLPDGWAGAWVPIRTTNTVIGVLGVMSKNALHFDDDTIHLLTTLAEMAGNAIHRARLHERTEEQVRHLTALRNIDSAISANFDLSITLQLLIDHAVSQLHVDAASILLLEPNSQNLKYFVGRGFKTNFFSKTNLKEGEGLPNKALKERRMQHASLTQIYSRKAWFTEENFLCYYCMPLIAKGETLGILEIFHRSPLKPPQEWKDFLRALAGQAAIAIDNNYLFKNLDHSNKELANAYNITLEGWGKALELRDKETQGHTLNVTELTLQLAREMGITEESLIHIYRGALLHDIGKMGIPDKILRKPGPLNKEEWLIMRQHPQFAYQMISSIPYLLPALDIPYSHHERWDGTGYPQKLKGDEIPLAARIFSIVDVWDALLSDRPYRKAWEKKTVIDYIKRERGTRFDPKIVDVFLSIVEKK